MTVALEMGGRSGVQLALVMVDGVPWLPAENVRGPCILTPADWVEWYGGLGFPESFAMTPEDRENWWWDGFRAPGALGDDGWTLQRTELWRAAWGDDNRRGEG